jgi:hypothetical protein
MNTNIIQELTDDELSALIEACNTVCKDVNRPRPSWCYAGRDTHQKLIAEEFRRSKK